MSPRTVQKNLAIQEVSRAKIVDTALTLFALHGYDSTTTRQIAEHAGISLGLMYHYFPSKEDLLKVVFQRCVAPMRQVIADVQAKPTPEEKLEFAVRQTFALAQSDQTSATLFYTLRSQVAFLNTLKTETILEVNALRTIFEDCFRALKRDQPEVEAALLYAQLEGMLRHFLLEPETFPLQAAVERVVNQILERS